MRRQGDLRTYLRAQIAADATRRDHKPPPATPRTGHRPGAWPTGSPPAVRPATRPAPASPAARPMEPLMPADAVRRIVRARQHPARTVPCEHCGAQPGDPCTTRSGKRRITDAPAHPSRIADWARTTACCPTCQVEPDVECHDGGIERPGGTVHAERYAEAERTA